MQDWVKVEGLEVPAEIGVYEHEHGIKQQLFFDVACLTDLTAAGKSDGLDDALDYDRIAQVCRDVVASQHHQLIETIAYKVIEGIFELWPGRLGLVRVRVAKPGAVPDAKTVAVELTRAP